MTELKANHLDIKFDDEIILEDISLEIRPEQFILLVGSSGCGKSTLMTALAGLYPKYGGELSQEVSLNHQSIAQIKANHRAKKVAMLFQHPDQQFAMDRVEDELIFSLENLSLTTEEIDKRINSALSEVGIESLRHRELSYLSGGELQKVALAETLAMGAEIILLDEPFAAVDPEHRHELQVLLKKLVDQGHGILVSDHDTSGYENLITDLYRIENRHIACVDSTAWSPFFKQDVNDRIVTNDEFNESVFSMAHVTVNNGKQSILKNSSFEWAKDKITLITGPNGIGKSSLLLTFARLHDYEGSLLYQRKLLNKLRKKIYARKVGLVFQNAADQFLNITVSEEVEQARAHSHHADYWTTEKVDQCMQKLNLIGLEKHSVYELSGGQQKKLQILIMLIIAPDTLLLDEPLSGLDTNSIQHVMQIIKQSSNDLEQSIIMISHQTHGIIQYIDYHVRFDQNGLKYESVVNS